MHPSFIIASASDMFPLKHLRGFFFPLLGSFTEEKVTGGITVPPYHLGT
jgi:hypothetical protein